MDQAIPVFIVSSSILDPKNRLNTYSSSTSLVYLFLSLIPSLNDLESYFITFYLIFIHFIVVSILFLNSSSFETTLNEIFLWFNLARVYVFFSFISSLQAMTYSWFFLSKHLLHLHMKKNQTLDRLSIILPFISCFISIWSKIGSLLH